MTAQSYMQHVPEDSEAAAAALAAAVDGPMLQGMRRVAGSLRATPTARCPLTLDRLDMIGHLEKLQVCSPAIH